MARDGPDPREFNQFRFLQLRRLSAAINNEIVPHEAINIVAVSSKYGLIFLGLEGGFKVLKLENILDLDEEVEKKNNAVTEYPYQKVPSPTPCMITISADDMTLAVCVYRNGCAVADMYDIRAFADQDESPVPFTNVQLSSTSNLTLKDFVWNPVVVEMYAFCLSDGSLHVHELAEVNLKIVGYLPSVGATAVCWSPKGKQIVVGKRNGTFSQHKPTLEEAKKFGPPGISENEVAVVAITWLSTTLFAIVYAPSGNTDDKTPSLVFVSAQKGAEVTYTNYGDICYGVDNSRDPRYIMQYLPEWGMLICASSNSTETSVLGYNKDTNVWQQWVLSDSGRAELPIVNHVDSFPLGMGIIYCAQRKIVLSDVESYPAMPVFFLLSTSSLLCPFHMLYSVPGATPLVYPSEPIFRDGERKRKGHVKQPPPPMDAPKVPVTHTNVPVIGNTLKHTLEPSVQPQAYGLFSAPSIDINSSYPSPPPPQYLGQRNFVKRDLNETGFLPQQNNEMFPTTPISSIRAAVGTRALPHKMPAGPAQFQNLSNQPTSIVQAAQPVATTAKSIPYYSTPTISHGVPPPTFPFSTSQDVPISSGISSPHPSQLSPVPVNGRPSAPVPISAALMQTSELGKENELNYAAQSSYMVTLLEEMAEFKKEIMNLRERSQNDTVQIGTKEEMVCLKQSSMNLSDFRKNMKDTMESLNSDIHSLKNFALETYAAVSEADSREQRIKDPKYLSMLKDRSLDPLNIKKMQKIHQLSQYIGTQICEIQDKLDNDWQEYMQQMKNSNRRRHRLPSNEAIIKTVVNNLNVIHNLKENLSYLAEVINKRKAIPFGGGYYNLKFESFENELGKLADTLLQSKLNSGEDDYQSISTPRKTLSNEKQAALREVLLNRKITPVKPSKINYPSQSRLCSTLPVTLPEVARETPPLMGNNGTEPTEVEKRTNTIKPVSAFTANVSTAFKGSITQGIPVVSSLNRPATTTVSTTQVFIPNSTFTFKAVPSKDIEQSAIFTKSLSHSAFKNIGPAVSKPSPDTSKVAVPNTIVPPLGFSLSQNVSQPKTVPSFGFSSATRSSDQPFSQKMSREIPPANFSLHRGNSRPDSDNSKPAYHFSPSAATGDAKPAFFGVHIQESNNLYEDISPPDTPHHSDEEQESEFDSQIGNEGNSSKKLPEVPYCAMEGRPTERMQKSGTPEKITDSVIAANMTSHSDSFSELGHPASSYGTRTEVTSLSSATVVTNVLLEPNDFSPAGSTPISSTISVSARPAVAKQLFPTNFFGHPSSIAPSRPEPATTPVQSGAGTIVKPLFPTNFFGHPNSTTTLSSEPISTATPAVSTKSLQPIVPTFEGEGLKPLSITDSVSKEANSSNKDETPGTLSQSNVLPAVFNSTVTTTSCAVSSTVTKPIVFPVTSPMSPTLSIETTKPLDAVNVPAADCLVSDSPPSVVCSVAEPPPSPSASCAVSEPLPISATSVDEISVTSTTPAESTSIPASVQASEVFGKPSIPSTPVFGQPSNIESSSFFGQSSTFGQVSAAAVAATTIATTTAPSVFGQTTVVTTTSVFGQNVTTAATTTTTTTSSTTGFFGQSPINTATTTSSFFGQPPSGQPSFFGKVAANAPVFGQAQTPPVQNSVFGQSVNATVANPSTPFGQSPSGGFFNQSNTPVFGQKTDSAASQPVFGQTPASSFSFAKASSFGQQSSGTFGLAKSVFGQSSPSFGQQPAASSSVFGQSSAASGGGVFGQSGFFSGLGGKPNEENASKNVFGSVAAAPVANNSIFGNQGASGFGTKLGTFGAGSFSAGGGSVAQSGFGAFQQTPLTPQKAGGSTFGPQGNSPAPNSGGFGAPAAFGSSPSFGGTATFGNSPTFGGSLPAASPLPGSSSFGAAPATGFGNFAATNAPTFGSLASQTGGFVAAQPASPSFGSLQQPQGSTFGSSVFGGSPSFGSQPTGFGSPPPTKEASAFTQWRH